MIPVSKRLGTASPATPVEQDILFRATVVPFIAVVGGVMVGYLLVKPTIDDVQYIINVLQKVFPILKSE